MRVAIRRNRTKDRALSCAGMSQVDWGTVGLVVVGVATVVVYFLIYLLHRRQAKSDERMETIQRRQADALEEMAKALVERIDQGRGSGGQEATLSGRFERDGRNDRLVIKNQGPGPARVVSVETLNNPDLLVGPLGLEDLTLLASEEHRIVAAPHLGMTLPVKLKMTWLDSRGLQARDQTLNLP